jgi:hypothetical protein
MRPLPYPAPLRPLPVVQRLAPSLWFLSFGVALWLRLGAGASEIGGFLFMTTTVPCGIAGECSIRLGRALLFVDMSLKHLRLCCPNES